MLLLPLVPAFEVDEFDVALTIRFWAKFAMSSAAGEEEEEEVDVELVEFFARSLVDFLRRSKKLDAISPADAAMSFLGCDDDEEEEDEDDAILFSVFIPFFLRLLSLSLF